MSFINTSLAKASRLAAGVADATSALKSTLASTSLSSITGVVVPPTTRRLSASGSRHRPQHAQHRARRRSAPELLGEAIHNAEGHFRIAYTSDQSQQREAGYSHARIGRTNANISFRLTDRAGHELKIKSVNALDREYRADEIIFNVPVLLEVAIAVEAPSASTASDYERLVAFIAPVIRDVRLAELSDDDIAFIYNELRIEAGSAAPRKVEWLRRCAWLARETRLPAEAFYGWGRKNVPGELAEVLSIPRSHLATITDKMADLPEDALRSSLLAAINEKIVPTIFRAQVNETVRLLKIPVARFAAELPRNSWWHRRTAAGRAYRDRIRHGCRQRKSRHVYHRWSRHVPFDFYHSRQIQADHPPSGFLPNALFVRKRGARWRLSQGQPEPRSFLAAECAAPSP